MLRWTGYLLKDGVGIGGDSRGGLSRLRLAVKLWFGDIGDVSEASSFDEQVC